MDCMRDDAMDQDVVGVVDVAAALQWPDASYEKFE